MALTEGCVYVNGAFVPPAQATVPAFDHGYLYGDGLFETLRTYGGEPFRLEEHLTRLAAGLAELAIRGAPPTRELRALVLETLARARLPEAYLRITVTRGVSTRRTDPCWHWSLPMSAEPAPRIVLIDDYDSFVYNLYQAIGESWACSSTRSPSAHRAACGSSATSCGGGAG